MNDWWMALSSLQQVMFVIGCATLLFMIAQIIMMLMGLGDHDVSADGDVSADVDVSADSDVDLSVDTDGDVSIDADANVEVDTGSVVASVGTPDAETSCSGGEVCTHPEGMEHFHAFGLRLLSLRCLITFFCFGAWAVFIFEEYLAWYYAVAIGVAVGLAAAVGMALLIGELMKLQRDGTIKMKNCVGCDGEVYLTVPAARNGIGKVNILVQETFAEFEAVTDDDEAIPTGEKVKVLKTDGSTLIVERTSEKNRQSKSDGEIGK